MRKGRFDISHYTNWNKSRINTIIDYYGEEFFKNKEVLEVGCGWAAMGAHFSSIGANVTVSDAREEHISVIKERYPQLKGLVVDSEDTNWVYENQMYDVIIHFGLLYHLRNPEDNLRLTTRHCETLILETEVLDSDDPEQIILIKEETNWDHGAWGMAHSGTGCRPSYAWVERILNDCNMEVTRIPKPELANAGSHNYSWNRANKEKVDNPKLVSGRRAMWFCKRK